MVKKKITINEKIGVSDTVKFRGRTDLADIYIKEAKRQLKRAEDYFKICQNDGGKDRKDALWNEKQASLFTILLSVFALEAHINRIGHDRLEDDEWNNRERDSIRKKWLVFPNIINGKRYDQNSDLFKNFEKIVELRNYLVHFKDYDFKEFVKHPCGENVVGIYEHINVINAKLSYDTAIDMMKELENLLKK